VAQFRNTGALDLNGTLTLSEGPGSLRAGPFRATPGTTLGPGPAGPVMIVLGQLIPAGPWHAHVGLTSGRVKRSAKPSASILARALLIGAGGVVTLVAGVFLLRRFLGPARPTSY
jgi:hypothetical protein